MPRPEQNKTRETIFGNTASSSLEESITRIKFISNRLHPPRRKPPEKFLLLKIENIRAALTKCFTLYTTPPPYTRVNYSNRYPKKKLTAVNYTVDAVRHFLPSTFAATAIINLVFKFEVETTLPPTRAPASIHSLRFKVAIYFFGTFHYPIRARHRL